MVGALLITAVTVWGWDEFWFLTDDAFIAFRHVENFNEGYGITWNRAPFAPVEGATSLSWVLLLSVVWSVLGVSPPESANVLALLCSLATLGVCVVFCSRSRRGIDRQHAWPWVTFFAVLTIATHPTFLTWASSGLETAWFGLGVVAWMFVACTEAQKQNARWAVTLTGLAVFVELARPDGLLIVAATLGIFAVRWLTDRVARSWLLLALAPFALIVAQFVVRRIYYGMWLPNTYYAKVVGAWPEAGAMYLGAFVLEHGVWFWAIVIAIAAIPWLKRAVQDPRGFVERDGSRSIAIGALVIGVVYYVVRVGGDHFGFRVFAHLVPLLVVSLAACAMRLFRSQAVVVAVLVCFAVTSHTIGWVRHHVFFADAKPKVTRYDLDQEHPPWLRRVLEAPIPPRSFERIEPALPGFLGGLGALLDRWGAWLHMHYVCMHRPSQVRALRHFVEKFPSRADGAEIEWRGNPVYAIGSVGVVGYSLPEVTILDTLGLADRVVARHTASPVEPPTPEELLAVYDVDKNGLVIAGEMPTDMIVAARVLADHDGDGSFDQQEMWALFEAMSGRRMAHDRWPPEGYIEAFRPNVVVDWGTVRLEERVEPLTDDEVREIEERFFSAALESEK